MKKRWQEYVAYEFIGGSKDGELVDLDELGSELGERGLKWNIGGEIYVLDGHKFIFEGVAK